MRTDVLQVFATCLQAGPFLSGETDKAPELFGVHSTYRSVHSLSFVREGVPARDGALAERVSPWLRRLKTEDVTVLRPLLSPCSFGAAPDGAVHWGIISDGDRGIELWQPTWKARVIGRYDDSPFKVCYTGSRFSRWSVLIPDSVSKSSDKLGNCLARVQEVLEMSLDRSLKMAARQCLEYHAIHRLTVSGMEDLLPTGIDPAAAALAASAARTFLLMNMPPLADMMGQKQELGPLVTELWRETMSAFESAATAPVMNLKKVA